MRWKGGVPEKKDDATVLARARPSEKQRDEWLRSMTDLGELKAILERVENGEATMLDVERIRMAARAIRGAKVKFDVGQVQMSVFDLVDAYKQSIERSLDRGQLNSAFESKLLSAFDGVTVNVATKEKNRVTVNVATKEKNLERLIGEVAFVDTDWAFIETHEAKTGTFYVLNRIGLWEAPMSPSDAAADVKMGELGKTKQRKSQLAKDLKERARARGLTK